MLNLVCVQMVVEFLANSALICIEDVCKLCKEYLNALTYILFLHKIL